MILLDWIETQWGPLRPAPLFDRRAAGSLCWVEGPWITQQRGGGGGGGEDGLWGFIVRTGGAEGGGEGGGDVVVTGAWVWNSGSRRGLRSCVRTVFAAFIPAGGVLGFLCIFLLFLPFLSRSASGLQLAPLLKLWHLFYKTPILHWLVLMQIHVHICIVC